MKITIAGTPGSGKSTLTDMLAQHYDLEKFSVGDFRRHMAVERGMTIAELNEIGEKESWTDIEVDKMVEKFGKENDDVIVEGRLAWHFIPDSIKIFLDADEGVRSERILERKRKSESFDKVEDVIKSNKERMESDEKRYDKYYGINPHDESHFDIILDSTSKTPKEVFEEAVEKIEKSESVRVP